MIQLSRVRRNHQNMSKQLSCSTYTQYTRNFTNPSNKSTKNTCKIIFMTKNTFIKIPPPWNTDSYKNWTQNRKLENNWKKNCQLWKKWCSEVLCIKINSCRSWTLKLWIWSKKKQAETIFCAKIVSIQSQPRKKIDIKIKTRR